MPRDAGLYGQPPPKKQKKEIALPGSLSFTSQLSSLLATQTSKTPPTSAVGNTSTAISGRTRPSKTKTADLFTGVKAKRKAKPVDTADASKKLSLKETHGTEDEKAELAHARRRMESKARLYAAMQRGDYVGREIGLVDFDRKWAEGRSQATGGGGAQPSTGGNASSSSDDSDSDPDFRMDTEIVEFEDEFGRLRRGTRADKVRLERRLARGLASAAELEVMSARPRAPDALIYGDAVQTDAFAARDEAAMEELARKRDRSATPPPATHYRADGEIRTKGVGFYTFSKDEEGRTKEMAALEAERVKTESLRKEREEKAAAKRREIEERRKEIGERRAKKIADSFLDGLGKDLFADGGGGSGEAK
ncbi:hypothetical protein B0H67DRAFT_520360 [Lasiosphaeris hirsuta]|uniref:Uncharacterized protein n=1 Tax=Lasiosphaeris hirsuta TaxID=260670 RepID=A0AA40A2P0_9PEZI|nr:hypothetical protein B0H67DRAFT_520360 [Lasiosphaeris hirsuta]